MSFRLLGLLSILFLSAASIHAAEPAPQVKVEVSTEVRVLKVPAGFSERLGWKCDGTTCLTERKLMLLLEAVQGHREANVMQFPKVTSFSGEEATIRAGDRKGFLTGIEAKLQGNEFAIVPTTSHVDLGETVTLCGKVSTDLRSIKLHAKLTQTREVFHPTLLPVSGLTMPVVEGGYTGRPLVYSHELQVPHLKVETVEKTAVVPTGGTVVLGGWIEPVEAESSPVLDKIPHVNRLFKCACPAGQCEVIVLATTRVTRAEERAIAPMPREYYSYRLRNIAAADAAVAVCKYLECNQQQCNQQTVIVVPEPVSNTILLSAGPAQNEQVLELLSAMDAAPRNSLFRQASSKYRRNSSPPVASRTTPRSPSSHSRPGSGTCSLHSSARSRHAQFLSRPLVQVQENQTGVAEVGGKMAVITGVEITASPNGPVVTPKVQHLDHGIRLKFTPRLLTDKGSVLLQAETTISQVRETAPPRTLTLPPEITGKQEPVTYTISSAEVCGVSIRTNSQTKLGETIILHGIKSLQGSSDKSELIVILTPHLVQTSAPGGGSR